MPMEVLLVILVVVVMALAFLAEARAPKVSVILERGTNDGIGKSII
jgi:hypothetical protein